MSYKTSNQPYRMPADYDGLPLRVDQRRRCADGNHDEAVVPPNMVVYNRRTKFRRPTGERYCRYCGLTLSEPT